MNKKQLLKLLAAIVRATASAANTVMDTTPDEARTLVGLQLRKIAVSLVTGSCGCDEEAAKAALATATTAIETELAAKKAAKKAKKGGKIADADDADDIDL